MRWFKALQTGKTALIRQLYGHAAVAKAKNP
jgi:hypothetical protein